MKSTVKFLFKQEWVLLKGKSNFSGHKARKQAVRDSVSLGYADLLGSMPELLLFIHTPTEAAVQEGFESSCLSAEFTHWCNIH